MLYTIGRRPSSRLRHERYRASETEDQRSHRLEDQRQDAIRASETRKVCVAAALNDSQNTQQMEERRQDAL
jgi:hypothetical protein